MTTEPDRDRGALLGAVVAAGFGAAWCLWAASGLPSRAAVATRVTGVFIGVAIVAAAAVRRRTGPGRQLPGDGSMFSSTPYWVTVLLEVAALVGGNVLLNNTGQQEYVITWVAAVVGAHFVAFGRLFWTGFYWLGGALLVAAAAAAVVGLAGGGANTVTALCGLLCAASLFVAGASTLVRFRSDR